MSVVAVEYVRRMRGGSQSHLLRCSDGNLYVVKFRNNPQHTRVLANELFATSLAEFVGLPVAKAMVVEVGARLIRDTPDLDIRFNGCAFPCEAGRQFGSRYAVNPSEGQLFDYFPMNGSRKLRNVGAFLGMLAFDKWTGNTDHRQAIFWRKLVERNYTVAFIDQGHCFNVGEWTFPDELLKGLYMDHQVYSRVRGWHSFEPWLSRIENLDESVIRYLAGCIPPEWYGFERDDLTRLLRWLEGRRELVRTLISQLRLHGRLFPNWEAPSANGEEEKKGRDHKLSA
jgi:hypothetical protein